MSNEPRECACVDWRWNMLDLMGPEKDCASCNGTGRAWPKVNGERVFTGGESSDGFMLECHEIPTGPTGRYRIIVQPLPPKPEKEG